jgi:hypothetical protein
MLIRRVLKALSFLKIYNILSDTAVTPHRNWNLPVLPTTGVEKVSGETVPRLLWISFTNTPENASAFAARYPYLKRLRENNKDWEVQYGDTGQRRSFMEFHFQNTSLLWAFNLIHPEASVAQSDIWR